MKINSLETLAGSPNIHVILPIYKDVEMTEACIESAIFGVIEIPRAILIAINDGSPDAGMDEMLEKISQKYASVIKVLKNEQNLGFVQTVNRGFELSPRSDVVLLNSDVIVSANWLKRLQDVCYSNDKIGTVTPLSNNATICSFPAFLEEQELPLGWAQHEIDRVFSLRDIPPVDAPTGVGFCMYIKAACLQSVGYLNYEKFGRGYGEENDFCQRAITLGWRNVITSNIFAYHKGGVSFSSEKNSLVEKAMKTLDELHPNYHRDVQLFIKADSLKTQRLQRSIDLLRLSNKPVCLAITHELGGGVKQHVIELAQYLSDRIHTVFISPKKITLSLFPLENGDELSLYAEEEYSELFHILKDIRVSFVHFHHTHGLNPKIWSLPYDLGVKYAMTVHDFYWINANPTISNENGVYIPGKIGDICNPLYPLPQGITEEQWRASLAPLINGAEYLIFPSNSTKEIFSIFYSNPNRIAVYHPDQNREVNTDYQPNFNEKAIKIVSIGALGREKGADLLDAIAKILQAHFCEVSLVGYAYRPLLNVLTTGPYDSSSINQKIADQKPDFFLFTALWPETFSYTLSYAIAYGAPIIAPDVGAFPERLSGKKNVLLFDYQKDPEETSKEILFFIEALKRKEVIYSRNCEGAEHPQQFYREIFIQKMLTQVRENAALDTAINFKSESIQSSSKEKTLGENVLLIIWHFYNGKVGYVLSRFIPFKIKRAIKRSLSRRSIADISKLR